MSTKIKKRIAIFYTGQVRTMEKTMPFIKKNIFQGNECQGNECQGNECHMFAVLESENLDYYDPFVKYHWGPWLHSLQWNVHEDVFWKEKKTALLNEMTIDTEWKQYIGEQSGSMIEYYQMYVAFQEMKKKEQREGFMYDYVLRLRCDIVIAKPLLFDWEDWSIETLFKRCEAIVKQYGCETMAYEKLFFEFMNTIFYEKRRQCENRNEKGNYFIVNNKIHQSFPEINSKKELLDYLQIYLQKGRYIITSRTNLLYVTKRETMEYIANLGITYGKYKFPDDFFWFNAESQFRQKCMENKIDFFDSYTQCEENSLYEYRESDYLDESGALRNHHVFFFIMRN